MTAIFIDSDLDDAARRRALFDGQLFVFSPRPSALALCEFARSLTEAAFAPLEPRRAQESLAVEDYVAILAELKPRFIHHPECKRLIRALLEEMGCDLDETYFDVPRMRTATHGGYLTAGIAYAFHPHRDTWYSAPFSQVNWWMPMYEIEPDNAMAFHLGYWNRAVRNGSHAYDYDEWNRESRKNAAQHIRTDTRVQPKPEETVELEPQVRLIPQVGGPILFSAAQLHSTVPNTARRTRFSIDFRTVNVDDVTGGVGAPNVDSACTGTALGDFLRARDFERLPEALVRPFARRDVDRAAPTPHELSR
jgi:hypothetical protein